ncbi:hypothetical protein GCM10010468_46470 [Actinocorallia longicatena]|uniref:RCC1-like domain-containing protein n=2 Tax=Actinocorallia longicatena TaxID=111803 RepID=A0ABP6QE52_9ACTN
MAAFCAWFAPATVSLADTAVPIPTFTQVPSPPSIADRIDSGAYHTCLVDDDGAVRCWGDNALGQLGHGDNGTVSKDVIGDNETPASADAVYLNGTAASRVSAGAYHTCVILVDGEVACWGQNVYGILGSGAQDVNNAAIGDYEAPATTRVYLGANRTAKAIAAGGDHTCVITDRDKVMCWGENRNGELGYGNEFDIGDDLGETPADAGIVDLGTGRSARSIAAGLSHTCALMDNGNVFCWGDNSYGQLGSPDLTDDIGDESGETPAAVDLGAMKAVRLTAGDSHTCAKLDNGKLRCWGRGDTGATGSNGDFVLPPDTGHVDLRGIDEPARDVIQAGAGTDHTCAVLSGVVSDVRCWGRGSDGALGLVLGFNSSDIVGDDESPASFPIVDLDGDSIVAVTGGQQHTCAVTTAGGVRCWGDNDHGAVGHASGSRIVGDDEAPEAIDPINLGATITCQRVLGLCTS